MHLLFILIYLLCKWKFNVKTTNQPNGQLSQLRKLKKYLENLRS